MSTKSDMSLKTKKILAGIGIVFGTIVVFLVSFALSFTLIVNPSTIFSFGDGDAAKENEELKKEVQTLTDEVELLNVTVDKYKAAASVPAIVTTPETSTGDETEKKEKTENKTDKKPTTSVNEENGDTFSPETVTGTDAKTPEDVEEPITIIDISE